MANGRDISLPNLAVGAAAFGDLGKADLTQISDFNSILRLFPSSHHSLPNMSHQRSACDRCRGQKVRCPQNNQSKDSEPCARCLKVGVQCVTSSSRPLGRPRITALTERRTKSNKIGSTGPQVLGVTSTPPRPASTTGGLQTYSDFWTPSYLDPHLGYPLDPSNLTSLDVENPALSSTFETNIECAIDLQLPANDDLFDLGSSMERPQHSQDEFGPLTTTKSHTPAEPADTLTALSRLNETIARQISHVDSHICGPVNPVPCYLDGLHSIEGNPVDEMLQSTSQFVTILEILDSLSLPPKKAIDTPMAHLPSTANSGGPNSNSEQREKLPFATPLSVHPPLDTLLKPLSTPVVLMILSNYILLLELYDAVFSRVHDNFSRLEDICAFFQEIPEVRVAGLSSMKVQLYAKIIIQIIEHHFDRLEHLLGLPVEFGLSEKTPHSEGLLGTADLSHLLHVAMTQITGSPGTSGKLKMKSFRHNLRRLQAMLPG
jgi:hypothetical protein